MTKLCGIYALTHAATGRKYVGQSIDINYRIRYHSYAYGGQKIAHSIRKHGFHEFSWEILELCAIEDLNAKEAYWIKQFCCISPNGFNLTTGGQQAQRISEETRLRMSQASTGRKQTDFTKQRLKEINCGRSLTQEHREKLSKSHIGHKPTAQTIELRRLKNTGRTHSDEAKLKMRKPRSIPRSAEHCAKISASNTGRKHTAETKAKMSATKAANKLLRQGISATTA